MRGVTPEDRVRLREPVIDWEAWTAQATTWLSEYIRIDTVSPPGNEARACAWFAAILEVEGVPYTLYDAGNERVSLVARLESDGSRGKPLIHPRHHAVLTACSGGQVGEFQ